MSQLTIYKASAGSGKTYTITGEYIRLLFDNPENYRHILGVTFTNKATAEMKSRIISELYKLSIGEKSGYLADLKLSPGVIKERASLILYKIFHDYSHFTISTIDSFFQRVIRAFAREIGFYQGFEIELDQQKVLTASIDQLIFNIDTNPELKQLLIKFAEEKILEGQTWNINKDIESLGGELFKEVYKEFADKLFVKISDKSFMESYNEKLSLRYCQIETEIRNRALDAIKLMEQTGLTASDFKGQYSIGYFFENTSRKPNYEDWKISGTNLNHLNNPEVWYKKKSEKQAEIENAYNKGLNKILGELIQIYNDEFPILKSIATVQKNFYVLGMIADLQAQVKQYATDKNLFLISDTSELLHKLIRGSDAPFIFERTGSYINHFMIDEFQDTSQLQWMNFKPLIINSLAENNQNWVVGDVKQSIYRWRNSDWTILSEKVFDDVHPHKTEVKSLHYNWRSGSNIVKFNNSFFRNALEEILLSNSEDNNGDEDKLNEFVRVINNAYSDFAQLVPDTRKNENGWVHFTFVKTENKKRKDWKQVILEQLPKYIIDFQDKGYALSDIAILVRDRKDARLISDYLLNYQKQQTGKYRFDILSGDSLLLKNAEIVKWLVSCFRLTADPDDMENKAFFLYEYAKFINTEESNDVGALFRPAPDNLMEPGIFNFFTEPRLKTRSVYEITDDIITHFNLTRLKDEIPYLLSFQDMLHEYVKREPVDLQSFLKWWDEHEDNKVISMPDEQDAMRLMTFHTSKGLEFPIVLIPFGDWEIIKPGIGQIIWCHTDYEIFKDIDLLPVNFTSSLDKTVFKDDFQREKAMRYIDNINLLYVAFTRAIDSLLVFAPDFDEAVLKNNISTLVKNSLAQQHFDLQDAKYPAIYLPQYFINEQLDFTFGSLNNKEIVKREYQGWHLNDIEYIVRDVSDITRQAIPSYDYIGDESGFLQSRMNEGKIMHEIFQYINTPHDVDNAINRLYTEGKISEKDKLPIKNKILSMLNQEIVKEWFSVNLDIKNEVSILLPDGALFRPDRVIVKENDVIVIDYKFGEEESNSHINQVLRYMHQISQMGYKNILGYVWYLNKNKVVPVSFKPIQGKLFD